jgi:anti-anti-sigma factor
VTALADGTRMRIRVGPAPARRAEGVRSDIALPLESASCGESLRFDVKRVGTVCVLDVSGEADIFTSPALDGAIASIARAHPGTIVVSFVDCSFADCACLNVLIRRYKEFGQRLHIVAPPEAALGRILELTKLTRALPIHGSLRRAYLAILSDPHASLGNLAIWA